MPVPKGISGQAMDMHLMTLKTLAIEMGMETPDIFKDETYLRMHRYGLLTSQVYLVLYSEYWLC